MEDQSQLQQFDDQEGIEGAQYDPPQDLIFQYPEIDEFLAAQGFANSEVVVTAAPQVDDTDAMDVSADVPVDLSVREACASFTLSTTNVGILPGNVPVGGAPVAFPLEEGSSIVVVPPSLPLEVSEPLPGPSRLQEPETLPEEFYQLPLVDAVAVFRHFGLSDPMDEAWKKGILKQAPLGAYFTFGEKLLFLMTTEILKDVRKTERFISVGWEALVEDAVRGLKVGKAVAKGAGQNKKVLKIGLSNLREIPKKPRVIASKLLLDPYVILQGTEKVKCDADVVYRAQLRAFLENFDDKLKFQPDVCSRFVLGLQSGKERAYARAYDQGGLLLWLKLQLKGVTDCIESRLLNLPVSFVPYDRAILSSNKRVLGQLREDTKNCVMELQKLAAMERHDKLFNVQVRGRKDPGLFTPKDFLEETELQIQRLKLQVEEKNMQAVEDEAAMMKMKKELELLKGIFPHAQKLQKVTAG
ncbi:unnamed protein product [Orchesella dallaii]|uniref:Uncharacterized protein n=1 Tax=Orchesella dallaii TaxID=48710 RepID=A0ABP1RGX2_9HEXA